MPQTVRIAHAGGFMNPALNLNFVPDVAGAKQNALSVQRQTMQNQLMGKELGNYDADRNYLLGEREYAQGQRPVLDARASYKFLQGAAKTLTPENYPAEREKLINDMGIDAKMLPSLEDFQGLAQQYGMSEVDVFKDWQNNFSPQDKKIQGVQVGDTRTRHEKEEGRWFETTQEYDGNAWNAVDRKPMYKQTETQAATADRKSALGRLQAMAPMKAYSSGVRMNDDGSVYEDPITQAPVRLKTFTNTLGKRANMKIIKQVGEHVDDSIEVYAGLQDPTVQADLKQAASDGMWDKVEGRWSNAVKHWMLRNGIAGNSKTFRTIMHMQRMASEQRKTMLGTAVTQTELQSILAWMPSAGDSYETMLGKITLAAEEGYEEFKRWLDINKNESNMAPFYEAWNLDRFNMPEKDIKSLARSGMAEGVALPEQSVLQKRGDELQAQGMSEAEVVKTLQKEFPRRADNLR